MKSRKTAIIIQGGGIKGTFSAGVAYGLSEIGIQGADVMIGISSGFPTMAYFAAHQYESMKHIWVDEVGSRNFISYKDFLFGKSVFNLQYLINEVFRKKYPLQVDKILRLDSEFLVPLLNYETGVLRLFSNHEIGSEEAFWKFLQATITVHDSYIDWGGSLEKFVDADLDPFAFYRQQIIPKDWNVLIIINHKELHRTLKRWIGIRLFRLFQARHFPQGIKNILKKRGELIDSGIVLFDQFLKEYKPIIINPPSKTKLNLGSLIDRDKNRLHDIFEEGRGVVFDMEKSETTRSQLKVFIERSEELMRK